MFNLLRPFIFNLDPEIAHDLAIKALKFNYVPKDFFDVQDEKILEIDIFDIKFDLVFFKNFFARLNHHIIVPVIHPKENLLPGLQIPTGVEAVIVFTPRNMLKIRQ